MRRFRFSSYVFVVAAIAWTYLLVSNWKSGLDSIAFHGYGTTGLVLYLTLWIGGGAVALVLFLIFRWKTRGRA